MSIFDNIFGNQLRDQQIRHQHQQRHQQRLEEILAGTAPIYRFFSDNQFGPHNSASTVSPEKSFQILKKSVKEIETEPFESGARRRIEDKINRLQRAGATAQACILAQEIRTRESLVRLKDWDYKLLTKKTIEKFSTDNRMTLTRDGLKVHIEPLDKYCGNPQVGEAKDRIIPDHILEKLEEANERELFDDFAVLYVEKVKDPLLLGIVEGCEDYFLIAEWGEDITFEQITKGE